MNPAMLARIAGLSLATLSVLFSATGLVHLFTGAGPAIIALSIAFELAKIATTITLYNASPRRVTTYALGAALAVLVAISSVGIYGYLGRAYAAGRSGVVANVASATELDAEIATLKEREAKLLRLLDAVPAEQGSNRRRLFASIQPQLTALADTLQVRQTERRALASTVATGEGDVGDLRFAAAALGVEQETLARWLITTLALLLDPLAVLLLFVSAPRRVPAAIAPPVIPEAAPPTPTPQRKPPPPAKEGRGLSPALEEALRYVPERSSGARDGPRLTLS